MTEASARRVASVPLAVDDHHEAVASVRLYLTVFCRGRALIEIGTPELAVHFEDPGQAAAFADVWAAWVAAGFVPTTAQELRCKYSAHRAEGSRGCTSAPRSPSSES